MNMEVVTLRNQRESSLLRLPPEIRNRIYELALGGHTINVYAHAEGVSFSTLPYDEEYYDRNSQYFPEALPLTCRQIRHETGHMYFTLNTFEFREYEHYNFSRHHLALPNLALVKVAHIQVQGSDLNCGGRSFVSDSLFRKLQVLKHLTGLERVEVTLHITSFL